jgi:hypothetical protein
MDSYSLQLQNLRHTEKILKAKRTMALKKNFQELKESSGEIAPIFIKISQNYEE